MSSPAQDDFFIGYAGTPLRLRRFLRYVVGGILLLSIASAAFMASHQRDPGDGQWKPERREFTGTLIMTPYPMLHLEDGGGTLLLVGVGKVAAELPADVDVASKVRARGTILQRGTLRILELDSALEILSAGAALVSRTVDSQPRRYRGEIIDPKCFAGAMKPGTGKTHKACAALCLRGGIPPAMVTDEGDVFVVTGVSVDALGRIVGEPIEVQGRRSRIGGLRLLEVTELHQAASK